MGIFKTNQDEECLVGHVPIEISSFSYHFLREDRSNCQSESYWQKKKGWLSYT